MESSRLDQWVGKLLLVKAQPDSLSDESDAQRAFNFSLIFTGVRCILQYVILPFILPMIGIAADTALPFLIGINILAVISMIFSLRRFWQINYRYKWQYLLMALVILTALIAFSATDIAQLSHNSVG